MGGRGIAARDRRLGGCRNSGDRLLLTGARNDCGMDFVLVLGKEGVRPRSPHQSL